LLLFMSSRRRHTRSYGDWSSDVCSSDRLPADPARVRVEGGDAVLVAGEDELGGPAARLVDARGAVPGLRPARHLPADLAGRAVEDRKSTRLNSSHRTISYAVFCLKKKKK